MSFVENTEFLVDQQQWGHGKVYLHSICTAEFSDSNNGANNNVLLLHGAGHNTIVWTCCAKALALHGLRCFMYDFRHHGHTTIGELTHPVTLRGASASRLDMSMDMSMGTLVKDTAIVLQHIQQKYGQSKNGKIGLVGHSLGGAVAVRTCVGITIIHCTYYYLNYCLTVVKVCVGLACFAFSPFSCMKPIFTKFGYI